MRFTFHWRRFFFRLLMELHEEITERWIVIFASAQNYSSSSATHLICFYFSFCLEKLLTSEGRELRRALFSLKQIFQEDKDLVHGFVALGGLNCLVQIGNEADQNYQNYILRALGQVNWILIEANWRSSVTIIHSFSLGNVRERRVERLEQFLNSHLFRCWIYDRIKLLAVWF